MYHRLSFGCNPWVLRKRRLNPLVTHTNSPSPSSPSQQFSLMSCKTLHLLTLSSYSVNFTLLSRSLTSVFCPIISLFSYYPYLFHGARVCVCVCVCVCLSVCLTVVCLWEGLFLILVLIILQLSVGPLNTLSLIHISMIIRMM